MSPGTQLPLLVFDQNEGFIPYLSHNIITFTYLHEKTFGLGEVYDRYFNNAAKIPCIAHPEHKPLQFL